ncbi:hypothetical protein Xkoz_01296 [Xenorhabdus kozodoii]|uniref:Uncharacterized protein n=1 Tax=Xenorhabdus kozodoii TaxID=351676 RepID=A0A2D0LF90_9GAMM|nr:hypothetical protein Xkoz_01296 [Xenorhabdus kozodoii]
MNALSIIIILLMLFPCLVNASEVSTALAKENETTTRRMAISLFVTTSCTC